MAQTLAIPKYPPLSIGEATHTLHIHIPILNSIRFNSNLLKALCKGSN